MCVIVAGADGGNADRVRTLEAEPGAIDLLDPRAVRPGGARRRARRVQRAGGRVMTENDATGPATPPPAPARDVAAR
jgi:hypothetical protein